MFNKFFKKINPISAISNKLKSDEDDKQNEDLHNQVYQFEIDPMENLPSMQSYNANAKPEEEMTDYILPKQNDKIHQKLQRKISKEIEKDVVQNNDKNQDQIQDSSGSEYEYVQVTDSDQERESQTQETTKSQESKKSTEDQENEVEGKSKSKKKYKLVKMKKNENKKQYQQGIQKDQDGKILIEEKNGKKYMKYRVKKEDTLYNICDDLNINIGMVMKINDMDDEHIFPGKVLDILVTEDNEYMLKQQQNQQGNSKKKHTQRQQQIILEQMKKQKQQKQYTVLYCTQIGDILGELKIENQVIKFTPDLKDQDNQMTMKKRPGIKFNVVIDLKDVNEAFNITLPPNTTNDEEIQQNEHDYTVQICLSTINKDISIKYKEKLEKLKKMKKSISFVDFKIYEYNMHGLYLNSDMKRNIADFIVDDINSALYEKEESYNTDIMSSQTVVPFYDILYENLIEEIDKENEKEAKRITIWDTLGVTPNFDEESRAVNNEQMLEIIEFCVPNNFRLSNWSLIYANWKHGTSINTLFRNCEYIEPCILIIEEFNGNVFGAYLSDYIKTGFKFYGSAECCVFRLIKQKYKQKIERLKKKKSEEQKRILQQSKSLNNIEGIQTEQNEQQKKQKDFQERQTVTVIEQKKSSSEEQQDSINNNNDDSENLQLAENKELNSEDQIKIDQVQQSISKTQSQNDDKESLQNLSENNKIQEDNQNKEDNDDNQEQSEKFELEYYTYTGKNENYIFADHEGIGIGGGDKYSIFINSNFMEGLSNCSETFDNPRLSVFESFSIKNIEVWGVVYDQ